MSFTVAIVGRPNVGKSTLLNTLLEYKLAIVSSNPQTTRHQILGVVSGTGYQVAFLDTPGFMARAGDTLDRRMLARARASRARASWPRDLREVPLDRAAWVQVDPTQARRRPPLLRRAVLRDPGRNAN